MQPLPGHSGTCAPQLTLLGVFCVWVLQPAVGVCHLDTMQLFHNRAPLHLQLPITNQL